ncbi:Ppx/GppA phosphatase family protein [Raoultibacter phocaeensis]|uniref:Ppx/GppA phosphatase family protein n=1 Tax=Raoultibacter phocaeensis TaxID=2479841 RepID=UPI001118A996|nr:exopolyphosphatase [Raoultibacter phocaeensis]
MPNYGVIDLGSNTIRLCVYEVKDDSKRSYSRKDFRTLLNNKVMAGLSAHVSNGMFTEGGVAHALDVLAGHAKRLKYFDCKRTDVFATAVLRNSANSAEAVRAIEKGSGFRITLLSAEDEAHLGFVGASCDRPIEKGALIDIGGGSTELTRISRGTDHDNVSLGQGSLSSFAAHVQSILPTQAEAEAIEASLEEKLGALDTTRYRSEVLYGIGGSVRAAAKMHAEAYGQGERPEELAREDIDAIIGACLADPDAFAHTALKAVPDRIHTLVPGCLIIRRLMHDFGANSLCIRKKGVREGYLIERMLIGSAKAGCTRMQPSKEGDDHD